MSKETVTFELPQMSQSHDPKELKKGIDTLHGIISVSVNAKSKKVAVDFDNTSTNSEEITNRIRELGFSPQLLERQEHIM
jgi:copper chaperone CopZ